MCDGCLSSSQHDPSAAQNTNNNGAMGDDGIAMKNDPKFDADSGTSQKFEATSPGEETSGSQAQWTGRQ